MSDFISATISDGVLELVINRPERRNAITAEMYGALADAVENAEQDSSIRVILLHGGPTTFAAGNDLADFIANPPVDESAPVFRLMLAVIRSTKVIVAAVAGLAIGIGTTLLMHCDLMVAGRSAKFSVPFVDLGIVPEFASSRLIPQAMGRQRASLHLLLGEPFDAETAYACGIVSKIVDDADVVGTGWDFARRLMKKPPKALAAAKSLLASQPGELDALMSREGDLLAAGLRSSEFAEAAAAFFEKRPPRFDKLTD